MNARDLALGLRRFRSASYRLRRAVLGCVESLEQRMLLSGTPFTYAITDADNHVLTLSRQGTMLELVDADTTLGTSTTTSAALDPAGGVSISGGTGADVLQVDFSGGVPFGAGGLTFTGGGASNSLALLNGSFGTNTFDEAAGTVQLDSSALLHFSNVGRVSDLTNASSLYFETGTGNETIAVQNGPVMSGLPTTEISGPNLTLDFANKGYAQLDSNGNDAITMSSSDADAALYEFEVDTLAASDTINVVATPASVFTEITSDYVAPPPTNGPDYVTVGNGTLDGIQGSLDISDDAFTEHLVIDDSADTVGRTITYGSSPIFFQRAIEGLTPYDITFSTADVSSLVLKGGSGGNTFDVVNTIPNAANVIDTGTGDNTVNVQFVAGNAPLTINGQGGNDTVDVTFTTNNPGGQAGYSSIMAPIAVSNPTGTTDLVINTTAESVPQTITAGNGVVTVVNSVPTGSSTTNIPISYNLGGGSTISLATGAGADTISLTPDGAVAFNVDAGGPSTMPGDTLNVNFAGTSGAALDAVTTPGYAHTYSFDNRMPIAFTNVESYPSPVVATADLAVSLVGPSMVASNGSITYSFTVTNLGTANAAAVVLSDMLPAGTSFLAAGQFAVSVAGNVLSLNLGALSSGGVISGTFTLVAGVGPATVANQVSVSSELPDPQMANNVATATTLVMAPPPTLGNVAVTSPVNEGGIAMLTGSLGEVAGAGAMSLVVNWGPGQGTSTYAFAEGTTTFSVTHQYLDNPAAPATSFPISLSLSNAGGTANAATSVVVKDVAPAVFAMQGPGAAVRGQTLAFTGAFADPGVLDTHTAVFKWGDGTTSAGTVTESGGVGTVAGSHAFKANGTYTVSLTITDKDGLSTTVTKTVTVGSVGIEPDPVFGGSMLVVGGTSGADTIDIKSIKGGVRVTMNGVKTDVTDPFGRIVVYGEGGGDTIQVDKKVTNDAFLYAGNGGSYLQGGGGNNVLVGGTGDDVLMGGDGRNILIGGGGSDMLFGGSSDDLLLSGSTTYAGNDTALAAIFKEWTSTTDSYATRIHDLQFGGGANGAYVFNSSTLINNSTGSILFGGAGNDWFIDSKKDWIISRRAAETVTSI
ncbi:MAG TPA: PKD domain-containing protein [Tepidisphaeraceae bacterium]|jgi:uncharacterized repeat protein (TIGR01451 family)